MNELRPAIMLDMDGVIRKLIPGVEPGDKESYIHSEAQVVWCDDVSEAFRMLYFDTEYDLFVVSNQQGIGRFGSEDERFNYSNIENLFKWMMDEIDIMTCDDLREVKDVIKEFIFCPHLRDAGCACRKPKPGMIYALAVKWGIDLKKSWGIGDSVSDMKAFWNAGIRKLIRIEKSALIGDGTVLTIIARTKKWNTSSGIMVSSLLEAARFIKIYDGMWEGRR